MFSQSNDHERVPLESDTSPVSVLQIRDPSLKSNCRYSHTCMPAVNQKKLFASGGNSTPKGLAWDNNMAAVTSCENHELLYITGKTGQTRSDLLIERVSPAYLH